MNSPSSPGKSNPPNASLPAAARRQVGAEQRPPIDPALLALAPLQLRNFRQTRSCSDQLCIDLVELAEHDQLLIHRLYESLSELLAALVNTTTDDTRKWAAVIRWTEQHDLETIIDEVSALGNASRAAKDSEERAKAMHDVRGGALSALLGRLQLLGRLPRDAGQLKTLFVLVRDHLKIMRSALVGLDESRRAADRQPKSHDVSLALEKWHETVVGPAWHEKSMRLLIDCRHEGALTECCLESAAIDRIFYNLVNNASRHAVGQRLEMAIFHIPDAAGPCLRFVLSNEVNDADLAYLRSLVKTNGADSVDKGSGQSLMVLFEPAISTTGSGFGLTVVADFVADAFGLRDRREALRERYVGAVLEGGTFRVWFHWPVANDNLPPKLDDYHQPFQSLSEP